MILPDHHLDLGCGAHPRNPYQRALLSGVDIRPLPEASGFDYRVANIVLHPVPFEDDAFGSVSAFDFVEHVPRILMKPDGSDTVFPFVRLMQEVWRVLAPGGLFYALTPAFPNPEAFVDPTHVNVITDQTHHYFCGAEPLARMYGFQGRFEARRAQWTHVHDAYSAIEGSNENRKPHTGMKRVTRDLRALSRRMRGKHDPRDRKIYFLWELEAIKDAPK